MSGGMMAIIKCKECGNDVSDIAEACPKCGAKVKKSSVIMKVLGGFVALVIIVAIFSPDKPASTGTTENNERADVAVDEFKITAQEIAKAYDANTVSADARYKGKRFETTGKISEIRTDMTDNAIIELRGSVNEYLEPQFELIESEKQKAAELSKGMTISLSCVGNGDIAKTPMMKDCVIR